jgi:hypothetical protein
MKSRFSSARPSTCRRGRGLLPCLPRLQRFLLVQQQPQKPFVWVRLIETDHGRPDTAENGGRRPQLAEKRFCYSFF